MTGTPSVGAVVVSFNDGNRLLRCLEALEAQEPRLAQVVVVDNGSSDRSPERIRRRHPDVEVVELGENRGLPAARNEGLRRLRTELALIADADIYLQPGCLRRLVATHCERAPAVVCPRIQLIPERGVVQADGAEAHFAGTMTLRHGWRVAGELDDAAAEVGAFPGGCTLAARAVLLDAGGFDDLYFFYFEDLEMSLRLRSRGGTIVCDPSAVVLHDRGEGTPGLAFRGRGEYPERRAYLTTRNRLLAMSTYYRWRTLLVLAPAMVLYEAASAVLALSSGWGRGWLRAWWWIASNPGAVRERRRAAQEARIVDDRELLSGGSLPLAPGLLRSGIADRAVALLSSALDGYWKLVRRWIG